MPLMKPVFLEKEVMDNLKQKKKKKKNPVGIKCKIVDNVDYKIVGQ